LKRYYYLYNLQGWMKGINAIENTNDPGKDGATGVNSYFGKDLTAFSLSYFDNDYAAINGQTSLATVNSSSHAASNSSQLFNGNIRYMQTRLTNPIDSSDMPMLNAYRYDQLNRLTESRSYEFGLNNFVWNPVTYGSQYFNRFRYDAMGNILTQERHLRNGQITDSLIYKYHFNGNKLVSNRLYHVNDSIPDNVSSNDLDNMGNFIPGANLTTANNYAYDEEGRLIKDSKEEITKIVWRVDGKVKEIQRGTDTSKRWIRFDYDAMGHRIAKHVYKSNGIELIYSNYYLLDASGNQIMMYEHKLENENNVFNLKESLIFGSKRLGAKRDNLNVLTESIESNYSLILGNKHYEFSNHLGNVLTVFSDLKFKQPTNGIHYLIAIVNNTDYSPFGVELDGRTESGEYRYGFNGMEGDDDIKGEGNSYDFGARMYDSRVGRFLSLDYFQQINPSLSDYLISDNNPIIFIDNNGDFRMSPRDQKKYPELTNILKNIQSTIHQDPLILNAFLNSTGLTIEEANSILEWGKGPKVSVKMMRDYASTDITSGDIKINKKLIKGLEGERRALNNGRSFLFNRNTTNTIEGLVFLVFITLTHEGLHVGEAYFGKTNNKLGEYDPSSHTTEDGNVFEILGMGEIITYDTADKLAKENQQKREQIVNTEKEAVNNIMNVIENIQGNGNIKINFSEKKPNTYTEKTSEKLKVNTKKIH
jgi:RHS repeat-associated protein